MMYNLNWLVAKHNAGERLKYVFFWGHQPEQNGAVGKGCFSQWWPSPFTVEGINYATAEHWMMAEKARLFGDETSQTQILSAKTPAEAKKLGRQVSGFRQDQWQDACYDIVIAGNYHKFNQHEELKGFLVGTGDRILVEASPVDPVWGIGLAQDDPAASDPSRWKGTNLLGFALMEVRARLLR